MNPSSKRPTTPFSCPSYIFTLLNPNIHSLFSKFLPLCFLAKVINNKFREDFVLTTRKNVSNNHVSNIIMALETTAIGEEAYQKADELAKELNKLESVLQ